MRGPGGRGITSWLDARSVSLDVRHVHTLARHDLRLERRSWDRLVREQNVDVVLSGLCWPVAHITGAVALVKALNLRLAGAFNGETQTPGSRIAGVNGEVGRSVGNAALQPWTVRLHLGGVALGWGGRFGRERLHGEGTARHGLAAERDSDLVRALLVARVLGGEAVDGFLDARGEHASCRADQVDAHLAFAGARRDDVELVQLADWHL